VAIGDALVGFYARESHQVVDVTRCLIQQESNNVILQAARDAMRLGLAEPFDARSGNGILKRLVVRTASCGDVLLLVETSATAWPQEAEFASYLRSRVANLVGVLRREPQQQATHQAQPQAQRDDFHSGKGPDNSRGKAARSKRHGAQKGRAVRLGPGRFIGGERDWIEESVGGLRLRATGDSFFQINTSLTPALVESALRLAEVESGSLAIDLFCGVGLFTLALARAGAKVLGIEEHPGAVRDARGNALRNNLNATFLRGDAARELRRLANRDRRSDSLPAPECSFAQGKRPDILLLDPPRAGAAACIEGIALLRPRRIVYVSCDPATLARDVRALAARGYRVDCATPFDLFPQTAHVETIMRLISA